MDESTLLLYFEGALSDDECRQVEEWADSAPENRKQLEQCYYTIELDKRVCNYEQADVERALDNFRLKLDEDERLAEVSKKVSPVGRMRKAWSRYGAAAAAFVAGVALTGGVLLASYGGGQTYEVSTAIGQRARVLLPDGTAVWLNSSTRLAYKSGWLSSERKASLSGEAYFDVKRNELKPFVVECQGVRTKVLGTKFNVRARNYENRVVTTLLKGSVQMFCGEEEEDGHLLSPGQTLSVDLDTRNAVLITNDHPDEVLLWIKGEMRFSDRTLADITATLSRLYNVKFHLADGGLKEERFTCHFKTDTSLDEILHTLSLTKYFSYHIDGNEVYVEGVKR